MALPGPLWSASSPEAVFAGRRLGDDLAIHYASADLLLFPSLTETFGNVTLEAMASGLAVLAFDYGAAGKMVRAGVHGWPVPYGDRVGFERAAEAAAADLDEVRRLGRQGRQAAETVAWSSVIDQVIGIYLKALSPAG